MSISSCLSYDKFWHVDMELINLITIKSQEHDYNTKFDVHTHTFFSIWYVASKSTLSYLASYVVSFKLFA